MNSNKHVKMCVTEEMVIEMGNRLFGVDVSSAREMVSYEDKNFHLMVSSEHRNPHIEEIWPYGYTLKIICPEKSTSPGHFDSMHEMMKHGNSRGLTLPLPVCNITGKTWAIEQIPAIQITVHGGRTKEEESKYSCVVYMSTYLPGVTVGSIPHGKDMLYQWGRLLARFHDALQDFKHPALENKTVFWDFSHILEIEKCMDGLSDQQQSLVREVLSAYAENQSKFGSLRKGLLHGDFNENNVIANPVNDKCHYSNHCLEKKYLVDGILDLEDTHYGTYAWDVAVMLAYTMLNCSAIDPITGTCHALAGYLSVRSLEQEEIALLKVCIACRLSQSLVLGDYFYRLHPENKYLLCAQNEKWSSLKNIWSTPDEMLMQKWEDVGRRPILHES